VALWNLKKSSSQINRKKSVDWQTKCIYNARKKRKKKKKKKKIKKKGGGGGGGVNENLNIKFIWPKRQECERKHTFFIS
jgi:hypothetical protein